MILVAIRFDKKQHIDAMEYRNKQKEIEKQKENTKKQLDKLKKWI